MNRSAFCVWYLVLIFGAFPEAAQAQAALIKGNPACSAITKMIDTEDPLSTGIALQYLTDVMNEADAAYLRLRKPAIIPPLSNDGLLRIVIIAVVRCRAQASGSARAIMMEVYQGIRDMQTYLGAIK